MKYLWEQKNYNKQYLKDIKDKYSIELPLLKALLNRVSSLKEFDSYINPDLKKLCSPFEFDDMSKAVDIINKSISNQEKILVFGDYDVDGITGTSILVKELLRLDADVEWFVPNRVNDGYGIDKKFLDKFNKYNLVITNDCGITASEEVDLMKKNGLKVIITDHHYPKKELPKADAIINPKVGDYPFKDLAGVGVVFKLVSALRGEVPKEYLGLTAIGTVADIVPLIRENRILVKHGLNQINNKIILEFMNKMNIKKESIKPYHISFMIGPRINSVGRLTDANNFIKLLVNEDVKNIKKIIDNIDRTNSKRKDIEEKIYKEADELIHRLNKKNTYFIILYKKNWHPGVIGIVASRLVEKYNRPVLLITKNENNICKGSGRSIKKINLLEILNKYNSYFEKLGGHQHAVGFSIKEENINKLRENINNDIFKNVSLDSFIPSISYDAEIEIDDLSFKFVKNLSKMMPFGYENKQPLFKISNIKIEKEPRIVGGNHIKFYFNKHEDVEAIGFNMKEIRNFLGKKIDILGNIKINEYKGEKKIQIVIKDIRNHIGELKSVKRENFVHVYNLINKNKNISLKELYNKSNDSKIFINIIVKIFEELGFIYKLGNMIYVNDKINKKISLENSKLFNFLKREK